MSKGIWNPAFDMENRPSSAFHRLKKGPPQSSQDISNSSTSSVQDAQEAGPSISQSLIGVPSTSYSRQDEAKLEDKTFGAQSLSVDNGNGKGIQHTTINYQGPNRIQPDTMNDYQGSIRIQPTAMNYYQGPTGIHPDTMNDYWRSSGIQPIAMNYYQGPNGTQPATMNDYWRSNGIQPTAMKYYRGSNGIQPATMHDYQGPSGIQPNAMNYYQGSNVIQPATMHDYQGPNGIQRTSMNDYQKSPVTSRWLSAFKIYSLLLPYIPTKSQLINLGFPFYHLNYPDDIFIKNQSVRLPVYLNQTQGNHLGTNKKHCMRCGKMFYVVGNLYVTKEPCVYHAGKTITNDNYEVLMSCCKNTPLTEGCTFSRSHIWSGLNEGINGPLDGFVRTSQNPGGVYTIYILACKTVYTTAGIEVAQVILSDIFENIVYTSLVRPVHEVIDFDTLFSGLTPNEFDNNVSKSLQEVQTDLLYLIKKDTILIGHALDKHLRALKLVHELLVDISILYPHRRGYPKRRSLGNLARDVLKREYRTFDLEQEVGLVTTLLKMKVLK